MCDMFWHNVALPVFNSFIHSFIDMGESRLSFLEGHPLAFSVIGLLYDFMIKW